MSWQHLNQPQGWIGVNLPLSVPASLADEMMASSYKRYVPVQKWKGIVQLQTKQDCCSVAANPPPPDITS